MVSSKSKTREKKERDDIIIERQEFWYSSFALPFTHSVKWIRYCFYPFFHFLWTFHMHKIDRNDDNNTKRKRLKYFRYSFSRCIWFCGRKTVLLLFWCIHFFVKCIQRPLFCFYLFLSFLFSAINFLVVWFGLVWLSLCIYMYRGKIMAFLCSDCKVFQSKDSTTYVYQCFDSFAHILMCLCSV